MFKFFKKKKIEEAIEEEPFIKIQKATPPEGKTTFDFYRHNITNDPFPKSITDSEGNTLVICPGEINTVAERIDHTYEYLSVNDFVTFSIQNTLFYVYFNDLDLGYIPKGEALDRILEYLNKGLVARGKIESFDQCTISLKIVFYRQESSEIFFIYQTPTYEKHHYLCQEDDWYLTYSYREVSVALQTTTPCCGNVSFLVDGSNVLIHLNGEVVGTLASKKLSCMIINFLNRGDKVVGMFDSEASLYIGFYQQLFKNLSCCDSVVYKIIKTSKKDALFEIPRYENLEASKDREFVELRYDDDTETYVIYDKAGEELGELSKSNSRSVLNKEEAGCELAAFLVDLDTDDNDKPTAKVKIFFK